ncbi:MAG: CHASE3 domain-containing protein [Candidatus Melainabacteria bacterium]|nr:CHASE3 domain-containing protein [Candidatus Melainabacteria bacterium]
MKRAQDRLPRTLLLISAALVASILLVALTATYLQTHELASHRRAVIRTQELIRTLTRTESALYGLESAQRGYLITGRSRYLEPYYQAREQVQMLLDSLTVMLEDDPGQMARLEELRSHVSDKLVELENTVNLCKAGKVEEARRIVLTDRGFSLMDLSLTDLKQLIREESRLLRIQSRSLAEAAGESLNRLLILALISCTAFVAGFVYIHRSDAARRRTRLTHLALFEVSKIVASSQDVSQTLAGVLETVSEMLGFKVAIFWRQLPGTDILVSSEFYSAEPMDDFKSAVSRCEVRKTQGLAGRVWVEYQPLWASDEDRQDRSLLGNLVQSHGLYRIFAFPIRLGEGTCGVFEFFGERIEKSDQEVLEAFARVGSEIGQLVERREMAEELQESLTELARAKGVMDSVLDNMGSGVILADRNGDILIFNKSAQRILGVGAPSKNLYDWTRTVYSADGDRPIAFEDLPLVKAMHGESTNDVLITIRTESNPEGIVVSVNGRPVLDAQGNFNGGVVVFEDVTARHEAERRVSEFYSMVSHELRTPLTSIKGSLGLLAGGKGGELSAKAKRLVSMGLRECDRLIRLINDILDIRKIEAGKMELILKPLDASYLVRETIEVLSAYAQDHSVKLVDRSTDCPRFYADRDRVVQVLTNLVSNAVKFSPEGGSVTLSSEERDGMVRFSVADEGSGISEQDQRKLFRKFQQVNSGDDRPKGGTGLGLSICKALVEQHGGRIGLDSAAGRGTTFWFEMPLPAGHSNSEEEEK